MKIVYFDNGYLNRIVKSGHRNLTKRNGEVIIYITEVTICRVNSWRNSGLVIDIDKITIFKCERERISGLAMENDKFVTREELKTDRRLTKVETNDKWFRWFLSAAIAVGAIGAAALIGIYSLLFSLQDDVATLTADVEVLDSRMDNFEVRLGNIESYLKLNGGVPPSS